MTKNIQAFGWGLLFGLGLIIAQMTNPAKVLAFLDVAGAWDPSLALVMASALTALAIALRLMRLGQSLDWRNPDAATLGIDAKLIAGAALFGIGWGLSGFCPGPALISLSSGLTGSYVFVGSMFAGFYLFYWLHRGQ